MKRQLITFAALVVVALASAGTAAALGNVTIQSAVAQNHHLTVAWSGPAFSFGTVQVATAPEVGTDGDFFEENLKAFDLFEAGTSLYTFSDWLPAGSFYVRVNGWDPLCNLIVFSDGSSYWDSCWKLSNIVQFTVTPVCRRVLAHRGYYTKRPSQKRVWHRPVYKTVCV